MDTAQVIDPSTFEKAPRKRRESVYDSLIAQILELPKDKAIVVPTKGDARAACTRMQTSIRALLISRGKAMRLSFVPSADGKQIMVSHRKEAKTPKSEPKPKQKAAKKAAKKSRRK